MRVQASAEAKAHIHDQGGSLYLWTRDFGRGWKTDETAIAAPNGVDFDLVWKRGIRVYVEHGLERPAELRIELRKAPPPRLKIFWGDLPWGARGSTTGAGF